MAGTLPLHSERERSCHEATPADDLGVGLPAFLLRPSPRKLMQTFSENAAPFEETFGSV